MLFSFFRKGIIPEEDIIIFRLNTEWIALVNDVNFNSSVMSNIRYVKLFHSSNNEDHDDDSVEELRRCIINNKS